MLTVDSEAAMSVRLDDLSKDELHWLEKLYRHDTAFLTVDMANRLEELGVAERKLGGTGLSSYGKRLLDERYAAIIRARKAREGL